MPSERFMQKHYGANGYVEHATLTRDECDVLLLKVEAGTATVTDGLKLSAHIAAQDGVIGAAVKMRDWFMHVIPEWDKGTEKAIRDFNGLLAKLEERK